MKKWMLIFLLAPTLALAQDVVFQASELTWTYTAAQMAVLQADNGEFVMYCDDEENITIDPSIEVGRITPPSVVWMIDLQVPPGDQERLVWCRVTAKTAAFESAPSNEWAGQIVTLTPGNLRLVSITAMLEDPLYLLGLAALDSAVCLD